MKVFVGMSGGVDSSLSAALLVEQGHDVTGVYMKNWTQDLPGMRCPWADDLADAKRVAVQLGIPLKVYDFETDYKHLVVDYMVAEYEAGRTPNPDIMCNQEVKFRLFLDAALADGAEMIATGHYAKVHHGKAAGPDGQSAPKIFSDKQKTILGAAPLVATPGSRLFKAADTLKDQTYFLYRVAGEALKRTIFPLGDYTKVEVRELAEQRGLATAAKPDSQGICFVGSVGIREFLSQYVTTEPGDIIDQSTGQPLGRHDGAIYYTLGQRHGLNLGGGLPYYVTGKDMQKNEVYVSRDLNDDSLWRSQIELTNLHWINEQPTTREVHVRLRHRGELLPAILEGSTLTLQNPERAVAMGQSAVLYVGNECVGGGIVA